MATIATPLRVTSTLAADSLITKLARTHGPVMFHQSSGCCDGSAPLCFPLGEFKVGGRDLLIGHVCGDVPVWIGAETFEYWRNTQIIIDVVPGRGGGMSLEAPEGLRFIARSRLFDDDEVEALALAGEPPSGQS